VKELLFKTVAVIGAGAMGAGIAQVAAQAGYQVFLFDLSQGKAEEAKKNIQQSLELRVQKGRLTRQQLDNTLQRIVCLSELFEISSAHLVIEAIVENLEIKQSLFKDLEKICSDDCILASNTSSISITAIASILALPERFIGLHFFNPAPVMKLVEVIRGVATSEHIASSAKNWALSCGKQAVLARSTPGFIVNRVARPFYAEGLRALEEDIASIDDIDHLMRSAAGFNMGPFELMDLIGHDVNYAVTKSVFDACYQDRRYQPSLAQKELVDAGFLGRKSGRGFYHYSDKHLNKNYNACLPVTLDINEITLAEDWGNSALTLKDLVQQTFLDSKDISLNSHQLDKSVIIKIDDVLLMPTKGQTATALSKQLAQAVVTIDYCRDYVSTPVVAISAALQNTSDQTNKVIAFLQQLDKEVILIKDYPGMIVWRTLSMLSNEALDLANKNGASSSDIDIAMKSGVNYPLGPIEWGERLGWKNIQETLQSLTAFYGEERYRPSPLLRQLSYGITNGK